MTGPAPFGGGMNSPENATHPTLGLGAKLGGAVCERAGVHAAPAIKNIPASVWPVHSNMDLVQTLMTAAPLVLAGSYLGMAACFARVRSYTAHAGPTNE